MTAPTTRETADHIGEANEKVSDHIGEATTMIDHAELARLAEAATLGKWQNGIDDCEGVVALAEHTGNVICLPPTDDMQASLEFWPRNAAFIAAANPATVLALLSEIAALRGERDGFCPDGAELPTWPDLAAYWKDRATQAEAERDEWTANYDRATRLHGSTCRDLAQAERQRDALLNAWRDDGIDLEDFGRIVARLANQGADYD